MKTLGIGLIGSGFMGRCHVNAYNSIASIFEVSQKPVLKMLADASSELASQQAKALQFEQSTSDWQELVQNPEVDVVDITAPNHLHHPIAIAAMNLGKPVYCEKPLACTLAEAQEMANLAELKQIPTLVGYNYLQNPLMRTAREIVQSGEIGVPIAFRGVHAEDYMANPLSPYTTRLEASQGGGVLYDLGSHIISLARSIAGPIQEVLGNLTTVVPERPSGETTRQVHVDDQTHCLVRFENGCVGTLEASWMAWGRKMHLAFELTCTKGTLVFNQEQFNELRLYDANQKAGRDGFKTLFSGPDHPHYSEFCPAPGHQLGFNELKVIELLQLLRALEGGDACWPDFTEAFEIQKVLEAVKLSSEEVRWCSPQSMITN
ncbi:MAG: 1-carboxy-3-chloro-3,4-dihydroxycyclo hexa-1,5-diene dehydrogenase [Deltaproteobacteria bacterium]|nr:1-carboxy-3-chloro-3,4-dihydroxycyclo hexa-1,5-diene dehydrogenase [Deltaproteobacteria bacterium]